MVQHKGVRNESGQGEILIVFFVLGAMAFLVMIGVAIGRDSSSRSVTICVSSSTITEMNVDHLEQLTIKTDKPSTYIFFRKETKEIYKILSMYYKNQEKKEKVEDNSWYDIRE